MDTGRCARNADADEAVGETDEWRQQKYRTSKRAEFSFREMAM